MAVPGSGGHPRHHWRLPPVSCPIYLPSEMLRKGRYSHAKSSYQPRTGRDNGSHGAASAVSKRSEK
eukprot:2092043-Rhodomonas_salina.1